MISLKPPGCYICNSTASLSGYRSRGNCNLTRYSLLYTMDTLSRAPVSPSESSNLQEEADLLLALSVDHFPASSQCIDTIRKAQDSDTVCSTLVSYCNKGWPHKNNLSVPLMPYWKFRGQCCLFTIICCCMVCILLFLIQCSS